MFISSASLHNKTRIKCSRSDIAFGSEILKSLGGFQQRDGAQLLSLRDKYSEVWECLLEHLRNVWSCLRYFALCDVPISGFRIAGPSLCVSLSFYPLSPCLSNPLTISLSLMFCLPACLPISLRETDRQAERERKGERDRRTNREMKEK